MSRTRKLILGIGLLGSTLLLLLSWYLPLMSIRTAVIFFDEVSILGAMAVLYQDGFTFLAVLVLVFAIIFPALKLFVMGIAWRGATRDQSLDAVSGPLSLFDRLGKWSMLDVFIAAVVVVGIQSSLISDVAIHPGLYCFAASVLLSMLVSGDLRQQLSKAEKSQTEVIAK